MIDVIPNWHPIFVHFTVGLLIVAVTLHLLLHFVSHSGLKSQWAIVARWNLWIGTGLTLITVAMGWYAFYTVNHDTPSHLAMIEHRNWAMATLAAFLGIAAWEYYLHRHGKSKGWSFTGMLVLAAGLLMSTAWHGGELVYRYGLGVMSLPKSEGAGHDHDHGEGEGHGDMPVQGEGALHKDGHAQSHDGTANGTATAPKKTGHTHAPGTKPHKD